MQCQCCNEQSAQLDWIVLDYVHVHCAAWTLHSAICTQCVPHMSLILIYWIG